MKRKLIILLLLIALSGCYTQEEFKQAQRRWYQDKLCKILERRAKARLRQMSPKERKLAEERARNFAEWAKSDPNVLQLYIPDFWQIWEPWRYD
jgi:hypothetical protein